MATGTRRRSGWLWVALILSLAANAFFLGAYATDFFRVQHGGPDRGPRAVRMELRWMKDRLPEPALSEVERALEPLKPDVVARLDRLRTLRSELGVLAAAPDPDRAAIDEHLRAIRMEVGAMQEQIQSRTFDAVLALPPAQRAALAQPVAGDNR